MRFLIALVALLLTPMIVQPAYAQDSDPAAAESDPYIDLINVIQGAADMEAIMAIVMTETDRQFRSEPSFAVMEVESPGLIKDVVKAMEPTLRSYQERVQQKYRPRIVAAARASFSPDEARELSEFFGTENGQLFVAMLTQNFSVESVLDGAANPDEDYEVTADEIERDHDRTVARTIEAMSPEQLREIGTAFMEMGLLKNMELFRENNAQNQLMMQNEPLTAEEEDALQQAIEGVFARRFPQ